MPWLRPPATPTDAGLSLVEVMVAMVLFMVGSLSLLSVLASGMSGTHDNRARLTATNLAAADIDAARDEDYFTLASVPVREETVDGRVYRITREVSTTMASGTSGACDGSGSARQLHKRISTSVEATVVTGKTTRPVRADTLVRAPIYDPSSAHGAIGFRVEDRHGRPLKDLPVTASTLSRTTDTSGCAFFDALTPGPVTVTVSRTGSVTRTGSTTLSKSVQVTKGQITVDALRVDTAISLGVKTGTYSGNVLQTGFEPPTGTVATIAASNRSDVTRVTYPSQPLPPGMTTTWPAFPSRGGYDAWLGECSAVVHGDSEPTTTAPIVLPLSPVTVHLTATNGGDNHKARTRSVSVRLQPAECNESYSYSTTTPGDCDATSNGNTCTVKVAVPAGTWTFTVNPGSYPVTATVVARVPRDVYIPIT